MRNFNWYRWFLVLVYVCAFVSVALDLFVWRK